MRWVWLTVACGPRLGGGWTGIQKQSKYMKNSNWVGRGFMAVVFSLMMLLAGAAMAAPGDIAFCLPGRLVSSNISYAVVPVPPGSWMAKVTALAGQADHATNGGFRFGTMGNAFVITTASASTTNEFRINNSGSTWASNDVAILWQPSTDTYTRLYVTNASTTNIICNSASPVAVSAGDILWEATIGNQYPLASGTATSLTGGGGGLLYGQLGRPLLVEVVGVGTNVVRLFWLSGEYLKP